MADSKRLHVLKRLTAFLEGVTPALGYSHNLAGRVSRGLAFVSAETPLPWVNIVEAPRADDTPSGTDGLVQQDEWVLLLQGWVETDERDLYPTDKAHALMADVKRRLSAIINPGEPTARSAGYLFGGEIEGFLCEPGVVRPPDELSSTAYFYLRVVVKLVEHLDDPTRLN